MAQIIAATSRGDTLRGSGEDVLIGSPRADNFVIPVFPHPSPNHNEQNSRNEHNSESEQSRTLDVIINFSLTEGDRIDLSGLPSVSSDGSPLIGALSEDPYTLYIEFGCYPHTNTVMQELWPSYCNAARTVTLMVKSRGYSESGGYSGNERYSESEGIPVAILTQTHTLEILHDLL